MRVRVEQPARQNNEGAAVSIKEPAVCAPPPPTAEGGRFEGRELRPLRDYSLVDKRVCAYMFRIRMVRLGHGARDKEAALIECACALAPT